MLYYSLLSKGINTTVWLCIVKATETGGWGVGIRETRKPFIEKRSKENMIHLHVLALKKSFHWQMTEYRLEAGICRKVELRQLVPNKNINYLASVS